MLRSETSSSCQLLLSSTHATELSTLSLHDAPPISGFLHVMVELLPVADALDGRAVGGEFAEVFDEAGRFAHRSEERRVGKECRAARKAEQCEEKKRQKIGVTQSYS